MSGILHKHLWRKVRLRVCRNIIIKYYAVSELVICTALLLVTITHSMQVNLTKSNIIDTLKVYYIIFQYFLEKKQSHTRTHARTHAQARSSALIRRCNKTHRTRSPVHPDEPPRCPRSRIVMRICASSLAYEFLWRFKESHGFHPIVPSTKSQPVYPAPWCFPLETLEKFIST